MKNNTLITPKKAIKWGNKVGTSNRTLICNTLSPKDEAFSLPLLNCSSIEVGFEERGSKEEVLQ